MVKGKVIIGLMAGFALGALAGIILAPEKGSETRKKISKKGAGTLDEVKAKMDALFGRLSRKFETLKKEVKDYSENPQNNIEGFQKEKKSGLK